MIDLLNKIRRDQPLRVKKFQRCIDQAVHDQIGSVRQILAFDHGTLGGGLAYGMVIGASGDSIGPT